MQEHVLSSERSEQARSTSRRVGVGFQLGSGELSAKRGRGRAQGRCTSRKGAGKKRKEGGKKGGEASQITARAGAAKQGAPADASGQASNLDAVNWRIMGAEEGCRDQTQQQITVSFDLIVSCSSCSG